MRSKIILIMLAACGLCSVLAMAQSAWIQSVKTDALTNISHVRFALRGKFLQAPQRSDLTSPVFVLDCAPHKTTYQGRVHGKILDAAIVTGAVIDSGNNFDMDAAFMGHPDPTRVLVRFRRDDEKKVQETEWAHTKDFASLYLSGAGGVSIEVNNVLYGHALTHKEGTGDQVHKLVISVPEFLGGDMVMEFDFPSLDPINDSCGLVVHSK